MYEEKIAKLMKQLEDEHTRYGSTEDQLDAMRKLLTDGQKTIQVTYSVFITGKGMCFIFNADTFLQHSWRN